MKVTLAAAVITIHGMMDRDDPRYKKRAKDWSKHRFNVATRLIWTVCLTVGLINQLTWQNEVLRVLAMASAWGIGMQYIAVNLLLIIGGSIVIWQAIKNKKVIPGDWEALKPHAFVLEGLIMAVILFNGFWLTALIMFVSKAVMSTLISLFIAISRAQNRA